MYEQRLRVKVVPEENYITQFAPVVPLSTSALSLSGLVPLRKGSRRMTGCQCLDWSQNNLKLIDGN